MTPNVLHIGRSWGGTDIEAACPCEKAPCGLVSTDNINPACTEHPAQHGKSLRQIHAGDKCPRAQAPA